MKALRAAVEAYVATADGPSYYEALFNRANLLLLVISHSAQLLGAIDLSLALTTPEPVITWEQAA